MRNPRPERALIISVEKRRMKERASETRSPAKTSGRELGMTTFRKSGERRAPTWERVHTVAGNPDRTQDELRALESRRELPAPERRQQEPDPDHARRVSRTATTWPGRFRALGGPGGRLDPPG